MVLYHTVSRPTCSLERVSIRTQIAGRRTGTDATCPRPLPDYPAVGLDEQQFARCPGCSGAVWDQRRTKVRDLGGPSFDELDPKDLTRHSEQRDREPREPVGHQLQRSLHCGVQQPEPAHWSHGTDRPTGPTQPSPPAPTSFGYTLVGADGGAFNFNSPFKGSLPGQDISVNL
jgi:hypothetical protein